jgi:uncharacterized protein YbaP (TraB family)
MKRLFKIFSTDSNQTPKEQYENNRTDKSQIESLGLDQKIDSHNIDFSLPEEIINKEEDGLLWIIEKEGLAPSYVLGTAHVREQENLDILEELNPIIQKVDEVIVETDVSIVQKDIQHYQEMPQFGPFFDKKSILLSQVITDSEFIDELKKCLITAYPGLDGFSLSLNMDNLQPWYLSMLIRNALTNCNNPRDPIDLEIQQLAKKANKNVSYLESGKAHIAITGCHWPLGEQILVLNFFVKNFKILQETTKLIKESFYNRKMVSLYKNLTNSDFQDETDLKIALALNKKVFLERNPVINSNSAPFFEKGNKLVVLGAGHLFGKTGLLTYLRQNGFKISCSEILRHDQNREDKRIIDNRDSFVFGKY